MKNYVVDLLNKGWITKSKSNYSFLIDGALCFFEIIVSEIWKQYQITIQYQES